MTTPRPTRRHKNTIRDVAAAAGVSIGTVSKALSGGGRMREETREKIRAAAGRLGFRPNDLAQSLHRNQSSTIGIISNDRFGRFAFPIVEAMEELFAERGIAIFMCNATDDPAREQKHIDQLIGKRVDGIAVTARRADFRPKITMPGAGVPVIYVFSQVDDPAALCLVPDDEGGARLAVTHLAKLGRRRIAHVTGPETFTAVRLRRKGYADVLEELGLPREAELYLSGSWSEAWGREAADRLFATRRHMPDAVFCGNDQIARGISERLRELGIGVPGDVAIVGFDNWDVMVEAARPKLTSVDMNLKALGKEAARLLIELIEGKEEHGVRRLPCSLVIRQSCGATLKETVE
jgi:LacI family transcriptional regulator